MNRALASEEEQKVAKLAHLSISGTANDALTTESEHYGTKVVIATPGSDTLRTLLMERIWGVSIGLP